MTGQSKVITSLDQVTPAWLTAVLARSGALAAGRVTSFQVSGGAGNWSQNGRLMLTYSDDAQGERPSSLFLKLVDMDTGDGEYFLPSEITYYTENYVGAPDVPLVRCYDGAYDADQKRYHVLLADMSETHVAAYDLVPSLGHGRALADGLAALHAHWWGETRLRQGGKPLHGAAHIHRFVDIGRPGVPHVRRLFGERLKPHWPALIDRIFSELPGRLVDRARDPTHFTLLHGDPNQGNILVPRAGDRPLFLIDQQPFDWSLITWTGAYDLAYLMAIFWETGWRRELEMAILGRYHDQLIARGVSRFGWDQLIDDYRLCVALAVTIAVEYMRDGGDPDWHDFRFGLVQHTLTAVDDWGLDI